MDLEKLDRFTKLLSGIEYCTKFPQFSNLSALLMEEARALATGLEAPPSNKPEGAPMGTSESAANEFTQSNRGARR